MKEDLTGSCYSAGSCWPEVRRGRPLSTCLAASVELSLLEQVLLDFANRAGDLGPSEVSDSQDFNSEAPPRVNSFHHDADVFWRRMC